MEKLITLSYEEYLDLEKRANQKDSNKTISIEIIDDNLDNNIKSKCEYCEVKEWDKKPLMINDKGDYYVVINSCNYLEDSVVGNSVDYSLFGKQIKYCPMCGREL